ncbi:MAG: M90 family metallopeptidase [Campylobacterota bacterium]|nr:M90 family metallopeptidase [Campylobacterota bacterium]
MFYNTALIQIILSILLIFVSWEIIRYIDNYLFFKELKKKVFPTHYLKVLQTIPYYKLLDEKTKLKLQYKMLLFIETKEFIGIKKDVSYEMKVIIAFYACLMIVNKQTDEYDNLNTIYVYPYEYVIDEIKSYDGIYTKQKAVIQGQSTGGVVFLSWHDAKKQSFTFKNHNVIIHEFAHELDFEDGVADGVPILEKGNYKAFGNVMFHAFKKLNAKTVANRFLGKYKIFGNYGGTNEAEFFAVSSELFFEKPKSLKDSFPDVYAQLKSFYNIDTYKLFEKKDHKDV